MMVISKIKFKTYLNLLQRLLYRIKKAKKKNQTVKLKNKENLYVQLKHHKMKLLIQYNKQYKKVYRLKLRKIPNKWVEIAFIIKHKKLKHFQNI